MTRMFHLFLHLYKCSCEQIVLIILTARMVVGMAGFLFFHLQPLLSFFFLLMVVGGLSPGSMKTMAVEGAGARVAPLLASSHIAETTTENDKKKHHFVLVHGICHGAWCWYKVATLLSSAGHRVTALDMAACGASPGRPEEVPSFEEYSRPLLAAVAGLPPDEKVVLVGHSFGGLSLALAMEQFPERVAVAVFVTAVMPAAGKPMLFVFQQAPRQPVDPCVDREFETFGDPQHPVQTMRFGPQCLKQRLYPLSPPEDLTLAMAMVRPSQRFWDDPAMKGNVLTAERYGAVRRVFVVAEDDLTISAAYQRQMASWNPDTEVRGLQGADHMAMFSKPRELSELLIKIADKYI